MKNFASAKVQRWLTVLCSLPYVWMLGMIRLQAAPVIYDTGVDNNFNQLTGGSPDPHYELRQTVAGAYVGNPNWSPAIAMQSAIAWPQWEQPSDARWIYIADAANLGQDWGTYEYLTTFDLTGYDLATVVLSGKWAMDQYGSAYLNGNLVQSFPDGNWNNNLTAFSITSGFVAGTNTLTFFIRHPDGGDGLIVSGASLTATAIVPPQLSIQPATNGIRLFWPVSDTVFRLQQNSNLAAVNWVSNTLPITVVNGTNQVALSPAIGNCFFRLVNP
jgi:hypothetical protein